MKKNDPTDGAALTLFIGVLIAAAVIVVVCPLLLIWGLNTLVPSLMIPYSFWSWLAGLVLLALVRMGR